MRMPWKEYGARPRLVCAAAQHLGAGILHFLCQVNDHVMVLDRAWAADHNDVLLTADADAVDIDHRIFRMEHAVGQLIFGSDADDVFHAVICLDGFFVDDGRISGQAIDIEFRAFDFDSLDAFCLQAGDERVDLSLVGVLFDGDDHILSSFLLILSLF